MPEPALLTDTPPALELRVVDGPQRGARTPLPSGLVWQVQAGPTNAAAQAEVTLLSSHAARVEVRHVGPQLRLALLEGEATLGSTPMPVGAPLAWPAGERLRLGDATLAYGPADASEWQAPDPRPADVEAPAQEEAPAAATTARWPLVLAVSGGVLVTASAALGLLAQLIPAHASAPTAAATPAPLKPAASTDLESAVADVFRLHGIQAQVARGAVGNTIEVHAAEADTQRLARAEAAIRRDLPAVSSLKVVNRAPVRNAAKPALEDNPGKRITGVVADEELPYLVTADGSRYFQGAWLPSGHRVVSIADRRVTVELDGVSTELAL